MTMKTSQRHDDRVPTGLGVLRAKKKVRMTGARSTAVYHAA
jgi:hypothetical protein